MKCKPLEYYIHIPFCVKKCHYCDFLSFPAEKALQSTYLDRLNEEIQRFDPQKEYEVSTIFIGGGTPSLLKSGEIRRLLHSIKDNHPICTNAEITIESNPGTMTAEKLSAYLECGINRLSIGVQSLKDEELKLLGRIHTTDDFYRNYYQARELGFSNINLDLMSALPGQSTASWNDTLQKAVALHPEHISAYSLIIEEGTLFYDRYADDEARKEAGEEPFLLPSEQEERDMYYDTLSYLSQNGYHRYEISNYAKPGLECRHNIGYWERKDYIGFGLGAASLLRNVRFSNPSRMSDYLSPAKEVTGEPLSISDQIAETMFLGLRMMKGVSKAEFYQRFHTQIHDVYPSQISKLTKNGLISENESFVFLTEKGVDLANLVMSEFL